MVNKEYREKVKVRYSNNKILNKDDKKNQVYIRLIDLDNAMTYNKNKYYKCVDSIGRLYKEGTLNQAEYNELSDKILKIIDNLDKSRGEIFKKLCAIVDRKFGKDKL